MSCPWSEIQLSQSIDFVDIMSEEFAKDLQSKENKKYLEHLDIGKLDEAALPIPSGAKAGSSPIYGTQMTEDIADEILNAISDESVESDAAIAQMLQMQFDKEYDEMLKKTEQKVNGTSKVSVSFENFKRAPQNFDFESDSEPEEVEDIRDRKDWDRFDTLQRDIDSIPPRGYKVQQNGNIITKHDLINSGRKNACKLLSFPPEFHTGDGENFDLKLSNRVYNNLKKHSNKEQARRFKIQDKKEDRATTEFGFDRNTRILIYKIVNGGLLNSVNGAISIGKEAVIIHADSNPDFPFAKQPLPKECAIKVYKTTLAKFKRRDQYIKDDHRFKDIIGKQSCRKIIHIWAEKEMANLMRLERVGIKCPKVVTLKKNVLVMSFIGENNKPAPKLKDAVMSKAEYINAFGQIFEYMKKMYQEANLIHADLSEYNILWFKDTCYFIDVSQSVEPSHENAFVFLYRDCCNIINFFKKKGIQNIIPPEMLFGQITHCHYKDKVEHQYLMLQASFKMKPHLVDKPGIESPFVFESAWEKSQEELLKANMNNQVPNVDKITLTAKQLSLVDPPLA